MGIPHFEMSRNKIVLKSRLQKNPGCRKKYFSGVGDPASFEIVHTSLHFS